MSKTAWALKQLLPFTYRTKYGENGKQYFCVWQMWFGKCFNATTVEIVRQTF